MEMIYSEREILVQYREAKSKGKQLGILADLNTCTRQEMRNWLLEHGVPEEELPRLPGRKKSMESTSTGIPEAVWYAIEKEITEAEKRIKDSEECLALKRAELDELQAVVDQDKQCVKTLQEFLAGKICIK